MIIYSVIIVTFNSENEINDCIQSVIVNLKNFEILILDNNSSDNTLKKIDLNSFQGKLITLKQNIGYSKACNMLSNIAQGEILIFMNPDCKILTFRDKKQIESKMVITPVVVYNNGIKQEIIKKFPTILTQVCDAFAISKISLFSKYHLGEVLSLESGMYNQELYVESVSGAFLVMRKDLFLNMNGFDEDYFVYAEEMDFLYRLKKIGGKILYDQSFSVEHGHGKSAKNFTYMHTLIQHNRSLFVKKNYSYFHYFLFRYIGIFVYELLRCGFFYFEGRNVNSVKTRFKVHANTMYWVFFKKNLYSNFDFII